MAKAQKLTPFLWFDKQAEEAANFYTSIFKKSKIVKTIRHANGVNVVKFALAGQEFTALDGGPMFKLNPSISLFVSCKSAAELKSVWKKLSDGGMVMMPLAKYEWSEQYGWVQDRFGVSWQVMQGGFASTKQKFMPCLLFTGPQRGQAEAAVNFYVEQFPGGEIAELHRYAAGEAGPEGSLKYAEFQIAGQSFAAMDNPMAEPDFTFNEAFSFVVNCKGQKEVDDYWSKLTADGGQESQCAWLKDKFNVSWQIVPDALTKLLGDPDPAVAQRTIANMMQMRKINIRRLKSEPKRVKITVKTTVKAPVEKTWQAFTTPADIEKWNAASDDWHCPKAENDLRVGGAFSFTMAARDGSFSFDFQGIYDEVVENQRFAYTMADGRQAVVIFKSKGKNTEVVETFDAENMHSHEMQRGGWQAILDNFKKHVESKGKIERLEFSIRIAAPAAKVYSSMIGEEGYADWTSVFNPTSRFEGSWEKGSKMLFVGTDENGEIGGMVSHIKDLRPNKLVAIQHLGIIEKGEEITSGPKVEGWAGGMEIYSFQPDGDGTALRVQLDSVQDFKSYFLETYPKALERLKAICEG